MKQSLFASFVFSVMAIIFSQHGSNPEAELVTLSKEFSEAMVTNDASRMGTYLADEWIVVGPDGQIIDRARFLGVIQSGTLVHEAMDSEDVRVRIYGTTAVVTALTSSKAKYMNREFSTRERTTDVFVKRDGRWQCVITHLTTFTKE